MGGKLCQGTIKGITVEDNFAGETLADFSLLVEGIIVVVQAIERGNGHYLGNCTEKEDIAVLDVRHVLNAVWNVSKSIADHSMKAFTSTSLVGAVLEIEDGLAEVSPNFLWPKQAWRIFHHIFIIIADDVSLLEEKSHAVSHIEVISKMGIFNTALGKDTCKTMTHQSCDVVAVQVVVSRGLDRVFEEMAHAHGHLVSDIGNNLSIFRLELLVFLGYAVKLFEKGAFFALANASNAPLVIFKVGVEDGKLFLLVCN